MSGEWEEYCESMGCSAGSAEDYEYMLDMLEEPVTTKPPATTIKEIEPTIGRDELIAALVNGVFRGGLDVQIEAQNLDPFGGQYMPHSLDGLPDTPFPNLFLRIEYEIYVPITSLIDAMRTSGVPLLWNEGIWFAWDAREKCLKVTPLTVESLWHHDPGARPERPKDGRDQRVERLLRRAALSTDHGKKPLLLRSEFLNDAMQCREVEFESPCQIVAEDIQRYALAFYDSQGEPASVPLSQAVELGYPICTRNAAYKVCGRDLVPLLSNAKLLAGAFQIATLVNPNDFQWFLARERGTVFNSAIERIESPKNPRASPPVRGHVYWQDPQKRTYITSLTEDALSIASHIAELASKIGTVYLTQSDHPLEEDLVTTPDLYLHAVRTLINSGYLIDYNLAGGVNVRKANGIPERR